MTGTAPTLDQVHGDPSLRNRGPERADERLTVERAQAGDEHAFAALVERYGQPLLSLCYASTLDAAEAEDLAQEVFVSAWRGLARFRGESAFSTWLFGIARNACIDRARRVAVRPRLAVEQPDELARAERGSETSRA